MPSQPKALTGSSNHNRRPLSSAYRSQPSAGCCPWDWRFWFRHVAILRCCATGLIGLPGNRRRMSIRCVDAAGGQTRGPGQVAGYVSGCGEWFYGTRVGPGWYQGSARVARGCKLPFSVLRMLMQPTPKPPSSHLQARVSRGASGRCPRNAAFMRQSGVEGRPCRMNAAFRPTAASILGAVAEYARWATPGCSAPASSVAALLNDQNWP